jgi:hypothetical protein
MRPTIPASGSLQHASTSRVFLNEVVTWYMTHLSQGWVMFCSAMATAGEPLPVNGRVTWGDKSGFGVELNHDYLVPFII